MSDLTNLIARVEAAEGGDREIDALIAQAVAGWSFDDISETWAPPGEEHDEVYAPPSYTADLRAVIALTESMLPEWRWAVNKSGWAELHWLGGPQPENKSHAHPYVSVHDAATPALAMLFALLRALEAKQSARPARGDR